MSKQRLETIALHAGQESPDTATQARAVPITRQHRMSFRAQNANLFALKEFGNIYTRLMNPMTDVLEKRVAALEVGTGALGVASGQAGEKSKIRGLHKTRRDQKSNNLQDKSGI